MNVDAQEKDDKPPMFAIAVRILVASGVLFLCCCNTIEERWLWINVDSDEATLAGGDITHGGFLPLVTLGYAYLTDCIRSRG